jgi:hypothetical protein
MALSIGFGNSVSLLPAIQATRLLTFALVGLSPTEHTCFSWSRFRKAGFTRYGFKAGRSSRVFPTTRILPVDRFASALRAPRFCVSAPLCVGGHNALKHLRASGYLPLYPRGPRSGPGYVVPVHPHLIGPMRPACRHISTSPQCGLYNMPSLCVLTSTSRRPASGSVLSLAILYRHVALRDPGKFFGCMHPVPSPMTLAFDPYGWSRHFRLPPPSDSRGETHFGA